MKSQSIYGSSRLVESFAETLKKVKSQIEYECIEESDQDLAFELCMIIAEVYRLYPTSVMTVAGDKKSAKEVSELFEMLTCEHIRYVIMRYTETDKEIFYKKSYLRTLLYNSLFELNADGINDYMVNQK